MPKPAIEISGVTKIFDQDSDRPVTALDNVTLSIDDNEFFTLLGPSGCGKTTLLRLIAGFDYPTAGEIVLFGESIRGLPPQKRPVNTVFQHYALFPHMSVAENVGFPLKMLGRNVSEISTTAREMLGLVKMAEYADRMPGQLSGGQQQRVALARALAPRPKVVLLDEPLSALDLKLRQEMRGELKNLQRKTGITFVFVTHDQVEALTMSDRIAVMSMGRLQQQGTPVEIYERPLNRFVAGFIGETNFIPARISGLEKGLARADVGADIHLAAAASGKPQGRRHGHPGPPPRKDATDRRGRSKKRAGRPGGRNDLPGHRHPLSAGPGRRGRPARGPGPKHHRGSEPVQDRRSGLHRGR